MPLHPTFQSSGNERADRYRYDERWFTLRAMWLETTTPGGGPPLHFHNNDDETFHVLEGRVSFFQNSQWNEVGPGGSAFVPRGQLHTFKNALGDRRFVHR